MSRPFFPCEAAQGARLDIVIEGPRHEQAGVHRVPQHARDAILVRAPCSLSDAKYCPMRLQRRSNVAPGWVGARVRRWLLLAAGLS